MRKFCSKKDVLAQPFLYLLLFLLTGHIVCAQVNVDPAYFQGKGIDISSLDFDSETGESVQRVLLYNVGKDLFLNAGGYWGTRTTTFTVGLPLMLIKNKNGTYKIRGPFNNTSGANGVGNFLGVVENANSDRGVYYDRNDTYGVNWTFEKDKKASSNGDIVYNVKSYESYNSNNNTNYTLYSNEVMDIKVFKHGNNNLVRALSDSDVSYNAKEAKYGQWKIVTVDQVVESFNTTYESVNPSDATFLLRAQSFNRMNMYNDNKPEEQPLGWHKNGDYVYTCGLEGEVDGYKSDNDNRYGMFYCGGIRNGKKQETLYQTVEITESGWYRVDCEGLFYNADEPNRAIARLYAKVNGENDVNSAGNAYVDLLPKSYAEPYDGSDLVDNNEFLIYDNMVSNKLEASIMFYNQRYPNHLLVYVNMPEGTTKRTLELGIEITGDMDKNDFVFFDDFQLKYLGQSFALDEGASDFHGMGDDEEPYKNRVMILKRTFNTDQWNSICLPVNLTKEQLNTAFFPNPLLAKLRDSSQPGIIEFETVDFSSLGNDDIALHAGECYLIRPGYGGRTDSGEIEIGDINKTKIKAPYYTIDRVSLTKKDVESRLGISNTGKFVDKKDVAGNDRTQDYYTISGADYAQCKLRVYGTFQKLTGDNRVPATSYTFVSGKLYHLPSNYSQKGFSSWIEDEHQVDNPTVAKHALSFSTYINGIHDNTTSIDGITVDMRDDVSDVIYNIHGQVVCRGTGSFKRLPGGVYIVGGKKVVVK